MADIYLARASGIEGFEKIVVVKRILPELGANEEFVRLFLNEARLVATLQHANIAQVYDVGIDGREYFFAMEFVHGQDVRSILKRAVAQGREIPLDVAIGIVLGVCAGLQHAHEKLDHDGRPLGIIHRDVSPSNILVSYDGGVKLVDFGIAKALGRSDTETQYGTVRGKFSYMSPEQCQCLPLDRRSDVFAVGIVLYELSTCTKLFKGDSDFQIMKQIVEQPAPRPSLHKPGYPRELERIVSRALALERSERYATAEELQLDLEVFAREHKLAISSVTLGRFMQDWFDDKIQAWKSAQREGKGLGDHLAHTLTISVTDPSRSEVADDFEVGRPEPAPPLDLAATLLFSPPGEQASERPSAPRTAPPVVPPAPRPGRRRLWGMVLGGVCGLSLAGAVAMWPTAQPAPPARVQGAQMAPAGPRPVVEQLVAPKPAAPPSKPAPMPVYTPPPAPVVIEKPAPPEPAKRKKGALARPFGTRAVPSSKPALPPPAPKPLKPARPKPPPVWDPDSPLPPPP